MQDPYIGTVLMYGFNFAPRQYSICGGQLITIASNQSLFSLIGTFYGGDGRTSFGLPDLRGRTPVGMGQGIGLNYNWGLGTMHGIEFQQLTVNEMPSHTHAAVFTPSGGGGPLDVEVFVSTDSGTTPTPTAGCYLADVVAGGAAADKPEKIYRPDSGSGVVPLGGVSVSGGGSGGGTVQVLQTGGGSHFPILQPSLGLNYCIATEGLYPPRS